MSKIQDALKRASEERDLRSGVSNQTSRTHEPADGAQELWHEVRRLESSLANWNARQASPVQASSEPAVRSAESAAGQGRTSPPTQTWKDTLTQCERQLSAYDDQLAHHLEEQVTLEAQVATQERAAAQATAALNALRQRLADAQGAAKSVEAGKAVVRRKVDALRECQRLSGASEAAEQELQATDDVIVRTLDDQQRAVDKLVQYRQHRQTVQRTTEGLRHQLQQALARMETDGAHGDAAHE